MYSVGEKITSSAFFQIHTSNEIQNQDPPKYSAPKFSIHIVIYSCIEQNINQAIN